MIKFGVVCAQTGAHREATSAHHAINLWEHAPRTEGTWRLIIDWETVKEEEEINNEII
jgi:hypothetical protein